MERLIVVELIHYLKSKNLLAHCQHGFRRGRSTVTNLLECDAFIWQCLNNKRCCDVICIDFMRAFDKVSHSLLCKKLKEAGIDRCYLRWFADFLTTGGNTLSTILLVPRLHLSNPVLSRALALDHCCLACSSMICITSLSTVSYPCSLTTSRPLVIVRRQKQWPSCNQT